MKIQEEVARKLLQIKAIKLSPQNPFTWASGILSPIYCDNRIILSFPEVRSWFIDQMVKHTDHFADFDVVAGVATAGIPWGAILADHLDKPFIYVRSKAKSHGRQNQIEGYFEAHQKVLVIEDLISTGGSSLAAVETLQSQELSVVGVLANFQYGLNEGKERFFQADIPLVTLGNYETLINVAQQSGYIEKIDMPALKEWQEEPKKWKPYTPNV